MLDPTAMTVLGRPFVDELPGPDGAATRRWRRRA
jgi:hypothetical protein